MSTAAAATTSVAGTAYGPEAPLVVTRFGCLPSDWRPRSASTDHDAIAASRKHPDDDPVRRQCR
jgi:hypothetical protein